MHLQKIAFFKSIVEVSAIYVSVYLKLNISLWEQTYKQTLRDYLFFSYPLVSSQPLPTQWVHNKYILTFRPYAKGICYILSLIESWCSWVLMFYQPWRCLLLRNRTTRYASNQFFRKIYWRSTFFFRHFCQNNPIFKPTRFYSTKLSNYIFSI